MGWQDAPPIAGGQPQWMQAPPVDQPSMLSQFGSALRQAAWPTAPGEGVVPASQLADPAMLQQAAQTLPGQVASSVGQAAWPTAPGQGIVPTVTGAAEGLYNTALGGAEKLLPGQPGPNSEEPAWDQMVQGLKNNYGSVENLKKTIATNPLGVLEDFGSLLVGGEAAKAGEVGAAAKPAVEAAAPTTAAQAATELGVKVPRIITGDYPRSVEDIAQKMTQLPIVGAKLSSASAKAFEDIGNKVQETGATLGSGEPEVAGGAARTGLEDFITSISRDAEAKLYNKVDALVSPDVTRPLDATQTAASAIDARRANASLPADSKATGIVQGALARPEGLNYQGVKDLRTYVRGQLDSGLLSDPENGEMKQIYTALTTDLKGTIQKAGGDEAVTAFNDANAKAAQMADIRQNLVKLTGTSTDAGIVAKIISYASKGPPGKIGSMTNTAQLSRVRDAIPPQVMDEIASTWISKAGLDRVGNFSPTRFISEWNRLSDSGKQILFRSPDNKGVARTLDNVALLSEKADKMQQYINTSKTTPAAYLAALPHLLWIEPVTTLSTLFGGVVMGHIWSKPATARATLNFVKDYGRAAEYPTVGAKRLLTKAASVLATVVAQEVKRPDLAPVILQKLSGVTPPSQPNI